MLDDYFHTFSAPQALRQLLGKIDRTVLTARAAKRHGQARKPLALVGVYAGFDQRRHARQKFVDALLLIQILDHLRILARESFESVFAARIRNGARIENEPAAVSGLIFRYALAVGKAENSNRQYVLWRESALHLLSSRKAQI